MCLFYLGSTTKHLTIRGPDDRTPAVFALFQQTNKLAFVHKVYKSVCVTYLIKLYTILKVLVLWVKWCKLFQDSIKTYATINTDAWHTQRFNYTPPIWNISTKNMLLLQWKVYIKSKTCISFKKQTRNPIGYGSDVYSILWKQKLKIT